MTYGDTHSSGTAREFGTGARRDSNAGKDRFDLLPVPALRRIARRYAEGAELYGDWNWLKGQPNSVLYEAAIRHLMQWREDPDRTDEDHLAACAWNLLALLTNDELGRTDLDDIERFKNASPADSQGGSSEGTGCAGGRCLCRPQEGAEVLGAEAQRRGGPDLPR